MKHKLLLLDRDGVICEGTPRGVYLLHLEEFKLIPDIEQLVKIAKENGYNIAVVTNQPQIAKGLMTREELDKIHIYMKELLPEIDRIFVCPHQDSDNCDCRKPKTKMLIDAAEVLDSDLAQSIIIGDSYREVEAGKAVGAKTIFLKNEHNDKDLGQCQPDFVVNTLKEAKTIIFQ